MAMSPRVSFVSAAVVDSGGGGVLLELMDSKSGGLLTVSDDNLALLSAMDQHREDVLPEHVPVFRVALRRSRGPGALDVVCTARFEKQLAPQEFAELCALTGFDPELVL